VAAVRHLVLMFERDLCRRLLVSPRDLGWLLREQPGQSFGNNVACYQHVQDPGNKQNIQGYLRQPPVDLQLQHFTCPDGEIASLREFNLQQKTMLIQSIRQTNS
jgi:hypothetical protein